MQDMEFTYHSINDGHPFNCTTVGWCVTGNGKLFVAPTRDEALQDAREQFPNAQYRESNLSVEAGELPLLLLGEGGLARWYRDGRPDYEMVGGVPQWSAFVN